MGSVQRKIALLGSGNFAWQLYEFFRAGNVSLAFHYARSIDGFSDFIPRDSTLQCTELDPLMEAEVIILAISDPALSELSGRLQDANRLLIHTSGPKSMEVLQGNRRGVFYIPQSMTKGRKIDAAGVRVCLEGDDENDLIWLEQLCFSLGLESIRMDSEKRKHLHLAAVFANNFTNQMYAAAEEWMTRNELPFDLLHPLIRETADKAIDLGPKQSQTGPAARGDLGSVRKQTKMLKDIRLRRLYGHLSRYIFEARGKNI